MPAKTPEQVQTLWEAAMNAGDIDGVAALYEKGATYVPQPGTTVTGPAGVKDALAPFVAMGAKIKLGSDTVFKVDENLAVMYGAWSAKFTGEDGKPAEISGRSIEIVRRQADGGWLYAFDDGTGRSS